MINNKPCPHHGDETLLKFAMPIALLALSTFAIGTTEFVIMGLSPEVAGDLAVSLPDAGWLISGYALGVAIGAPIMAIVTARLPRKNLSGAADGDLYHR